MDKAKSTRGRPRLNIELDSIVEVVFRHGQITAAARELGCSPGYIHAALRNAGLGIHGQTTCYSQITEIPLPLTIAPQMCQTLRQAHVYVR